MRGLFRDKSEAEAFNVFRFFYAEVFSSRNVVSNERGKGKKIFLFLPHTRKSAPRSHPRDKTQPATIMPDFTWRKGWHGAACSTWERTQVVSKSVWTSTCFSDECSSMYRCFKCSELRRFTSLLWFSGLNPHAFW